MVCDKEKELMQSAEWFLDTLAQRCLKKSKRIVPALQFPVFKKFLACRVQRELQYYRSYCDLASVLVEVESNISEHDLDELMEDSFFLDRCLARDLVFLPLRIHFDYARILPLRRERARKQTSLFMRLLSTEEAKDYYDMLRKAFNKKEFLQVYNELVILYTDETFIINSSLKSIVGVNSKKIAERLYSSILDIGIEMNREMADTIYDAECHRT